MLPERWCFLRCAGPATFLPHPLERLINPEAECNSWLLRGPLPTQHDSSLSVYSSGLCTLLCLPQLSQLHLQWNMVLSSALVPSTQSQLDFITKFLTYRLKRTQSLGCLHVLFSMKVFRLTPRLLPLYMNPHRQNT